MMGCENLRFAKERYEPLKMETIWFEIEDIITTSDPATQGPFVPEGNG